MTGRWTFAPTVDAARREPMVSDPVQLQALREMLMEIGYDDEDVRYFLTEDWPDLLARRGDPDAEYAGNGVAFRVSGDEVIVTPLYDQWGEDVAHVYVPLPVVEEMIEQYAAHVRSRA